MNYKANENYGQHVNNMNYTVIKNIQAKAIDEQDWDALDEADELEKIWEAAQ